MRSFISNYSGAEKHTFFFNFCQISLALDVVNYFSQIITQMVETLSGQRESNHSVKYLFGSKSLCKFKGAFCI